jgi:hypothetical protein
MIAGLRNETGSRASGTGNISVTHVTVTSAQQPWTAVGQSEMVLGEKNPVPPSIDLNIFTTWFLEGGVAEISRII